MSRGAIILCVLLFATRAVAAPCPTAGPDLVVDGSAASCTLSGVHAFTTVSVLHGGVITVSIFNGTDKAGTGNLELRAQSITVDATSKIIAIGAGYQTPICGNGGGPNATAGGRGGCAIRDSGGGGGHFGGGGRGTKDNPKVFPNDFEEDCGNSVQVSPTGVVSCSTLADCRNSDGLPSVAGLSFFHSIYVPEFGAAGGDKGCRDGDGTTLSTGGGGGGRIVLAALDGGLGQISLAGTLNADGHRGCGNGNDSGGGGAGGTILVVGDNVDISTTAIVSAAGGLGGDTEGLASDPTGECAPPFQQNTVADDCGGGGGGGIVSVLSVNATIADEAVFAVGGGAGGVSSLCRGEAGGGVGELQISGGFVGELCDGFDNDFDDKIDEGLPDLICDGVPTPSCVNGIPQECPSDVPACEGPVTDSRARFAVVVDTSGSMIGTLPGVPTFGDGSFDHPGLDIDGNGKADDSRLFKAKSALTNVIAAYPDIDFALARYHQDEGVDRSCQTAHNFECNDICCSYDNPTDNTAPAPTPACTVNEGAAGILTVLDHSTGDECINYAGSCGAPRRGADVLVGFGADINQYLMWLDGTETAFNADDTEGNFCDFAGGGDCELRGTGPTPLAASLQSMEDFLTPIKDCDRAAIGLCRHYGTILLTDGAEDCQGDPVAAATALRNKGIDTFVIGFSVLDSEKAQLNAIAASGGTGSAFLATDEDSLANALATIVSGSVVFETCNGLDDDCDGKIDEDFPEKGQPCNDGKLGACRGTGHLVCSADGAGLVCQIDNPGAAPTPEVCNGLDDDCNGAIDDGISCTPGCVPTGRDICNGLDDDCDGAIDEDDPNVGTACGVSDTLPCKLGVNVCISGAIVCEGNVDPGPEICNGIDDNCDGIPDNNAPCPDPTSCVDGGCRLPCDSGELQCPGGLECVTAPEGRFCVPSPCAHCTDIEICVNDACVDPCASLSCPANEQCRLGTCLDCNVLGCPAGDVCSQKQCIADPCANVDCTTSCTSDLGCSCQDGTCVPNCDSTQCPEHQSCGPDGTCAADTCAGVQCTSKQVCKSGACVDDPCLGIICPAGEACDFTGTCIDNPCKLVTCSDGFTCALDGDQAICTPDHPGGLVRVSAGGGGGCDASGGSSGGLVLVLGVLGAVASRRRRGGVAVVALAAMAAAGCNLRVYQLGSDGTGDGGLGGDGGSGGNGDGGSGGNGDGSAACVPTGPDDTCNMIDDDCDGIVDNNFDLQNDPNNCGACNHRCEGDGAVFDCLSGQCVFTACQPGFADLNGDHLDCEYQCPLFPPRAEDCNGVDDDCDGIIDEDLPPAPTGECRDTPGTPCEGTVMICDTRNGETRFYCNYGSDVEFDPSVPNGIVLHEQLCDGKDGDCDGVADNSFSDLGQECDDGGLGVCRDVGVRACDPVDPTQTFCDLSVLPDAQPPGPELCDGLDNDCDGIVDNATGSNRVIDAMQHIQVNGLDFFMDEFEAAHPDATATVDGVGTARACSNDGVLPWRGATFATAQAACEAAGKVLCTSDQWLAACEGTGDDTYPYGDTFDGGACNTESFDGIPGGADDDVLVATGVAATCVASTGVHDLSGNLKEWTDDITGQTSDGKNIAVLRGGAYDTPAAGATCDFRISRAAVDIIEQTNGFRCCRPTAP